MGYWSQLKRRGNQVVKKITGAKPAAKKKTKKKAAKKKAKAKGKK
jgi:hypothetical protein